MTDVAFYAPLKSPNHPNPSGDRQMARNLMAALEIAFGGMVHLASEFRSLDRSGDAANQSALIAAAEDEMARLAHDLPDCELWVTYHNYYKAPDLIGPQVAQRRGIPYILIEATRATSRLMGQWARFAQSAEAASDAARAIFHFTERDRFALERDRPTGQIVAALHPFLNRDDLPPASSYDGPMLTVGMMRPGDKMDSYRLIADTLSHLSVPEWRLDIVGDGVARADVTELFASFGRHVRFLGALNADALRTCYGTASLLFWPGVNEAFGMVYLEAQAAGLPVVAQDRPGVRDVLCPGDYSRIQDGPAAMAKHIDALLQNPSARIQAGEAARQFVSDRHLRPVAIAQLQSVLGPILGGRA